jgi:hypothetical protein
MQASCGGEAKGSAGPIRAALWRAPSGRCLLFDSAPQPLDKHVVQCSTMTIHTDAYLGRFQDTGEGRR